MWGTPGSYISKVHLVVLLDFAGEVESLVLTKNTKAA